LNGEASKREEIMSYYQFKDENGDEYGSFEVFFETDNGVEFIPEADYLAEGYYWRACFPGCLPDGDPSGPFDTEEEAIRDAQDG
jgi:hypothetical protein